MSKVFTVDLSRKRLPRRLRQAATWLLNRALGFDQFNTVYASLPPRAPEDFSRTFLEELRVNVEVSGWSSDPIPASGPLVVVANHPSGILDGMVLDSILRSVRADAAVMAIFLCASIAEYRSRWIFVGRQRSRSRLKLTRRGWRKAFRHLQKGGALVVFPAGRVAGFHWKRPWLSDRPWSTHIATFVRRTGAPVLPVYLRVPVRLSSQFVGMLSPLLQNVRSIAAVSEFRGRNIEVLIGQLIKPGELVAHSSDAELTALLRQQTELLMGANSISRQGRDQHRNA